LVRHNWVLVPVPGAINGALLIATFLSGVAIYFYRDVLPWSKSWALASAIITAISLGWLPFGDFIAPIPAAYLTVWLGLLNPSRKMLFGADYSYGIFLYGFAVQQTIVAVMPNHGIWWLNLLIGLPAVVLIAAASWHFVEKPLQGGKDILQRLEDGILARQKAKAESRL
jgi:peptidoglycan/LPS O-acetylase OafA/YrhL